MVRLTGIFAILLLFSLPADATRIYQWVDDQGRVQFTQTPPPPGHDAQEVQPRHAPPGSDTALPVTERPDDKEAAKEDEDDDEAKDDEDEFGAVSREEARAACEGARERLNVLRDADTLLMSRDDEGNLRPMNQEEIDRRIAEEEARIKQFCID